MPFKLPPVYPILDSESLTRRGIPLASAAAALLEGGAEILQIRRKDHWPRDFFAEAREVARLCREAGAVLVVNDRADFAMMLEAGLHLGQDDLPPRDARRIAGGDLPIGFSTHNAAQLAAAGGEPVEYLALGPIFATGSKQNPDPVVGVDELRRIRSLAEKPLVAIGGIVLENAPEVWRGGADSVAVIGGLFPVSTGPRALRERMEEWVRAARSR